jgi:hypothetical protein
VAPAFFCAWKLSSALAGHEVHDNRDDGKEKKQMNEDAGALEHHEPADPQGYQNDSEYQIHGLPSYTRRLRAAS